ncbi:MAG: hypothetical protein L6W00_06450 [Lentisphaeria bacterium]|nr:MAG: hypothetical protein L6W00_06450 [Lentisphaeria bacterium]
MKKKTAPPFNRSGDTLTRHLNEVVLHQSAAIDRLRRLLTGLAAVRRNWEKREQKKIEAAEEKKFYEKLQDLQEKLAEFRTEQKKIIAQTEAFDPAKTDDWSEGEEKLLGDLAAKEAEFSQYFRAAFNDLSKLQSQDFSNSAMADEFVEMYEELQKAGDALVKRRSKSPPSPKTPPATAPKRSQTISNAGSPTPRTTSSGSPRKTAKWPTSISPTCPQNSPTSSEISSKPKRR